MSLNQLKLEVAEMTQTRVRPFKTTYLNKLGGNGSKTNIQM
jgi:hypothetical protein